MEKGKIIETIKFVNQMLVNKQYQELVFNDYKKILNSEELETAIEEYGGNVTTPPVDAFQNISIYVIKEDVISNIDFNLWIDNQMSDLTLTCDIFNDNGIYKYSIDDIRIL